MESGIHSQLGALAHPTRLAIFRLLMRRYPDAVPAGEIAQALDLKPNTASAALSALRQAGLISQTRIGTSRRYAAHLPSLREFFDELVGTCCQNRPDLCLVPHATGDLAMPSQTDPFHTLFICTGNSARSILAEAILTRAGAGRFVAHSAGTVPRGEPHPQVLSLLAAKDYDVSGLASKSVDVFAADDAPKMDFVFTVCDQAANEECPAWPGQPMSAHWGLPDPVKAVGTEAQRQLAFQQTYGLLKNRIEAFVSLPFDTLDRMSLQHRVDAIGRMQADVPA
jgi:protein-tyrosine-phosphatase/DNA-binding transcriptional ArsR family regulator